MLFVVNNLESDVVFRLVSQQSQIGLLNAIL